VWEEVLIAGYEEIRRFIPPDQRWMVDFENHFFDHGNGSPSNSSIPSMPFADAADWT
jgi:hypothetical protein